MSRLTDAISRGLEPGGDLTEELHGLYNYRLTSREDAQAVCRALRRFPFRDDSSAQRPFQSPMYALIDLFQNVEDGECEAFSVLLETGIPQLTRIFRTAMRDHHLCDRDDLLFILKILAMYGTRRGTDTVILAARRKFGRDAFMWWVILRAFTHDHPFCEYLFDALSDPLPAGFIAVALLDAANEVLIGEGDIDHPFNSQAGYRKLQRWLQDSDPDHFSYARSVATALPFLGPGPREQLLPLAMDHPDISVQLESAWASAKLGSEAGLKCLARYCEDVRYSRTACLYLEELDRDDLVPESCHEADFAAMADFAHWLSHPNELGEVPDEVELVDRRELAWPPTREKKMFWIVRYRLLGNEDDPEDVDCGLVGSLTFCLFASRMNERPPEDVYAIHCYWELTFQDLIEECMIDPGDAEYDSLLAHWQGAPLEEPQMLRVAEVSPQLRHPKRLVGLARAGQAGQPGWVVLDGTHSVWYAQSEMPAEAPDATVLGLHVGRRLLGFTGQPDRAQFLK